MPAFALRGNFAFVILWSISKNTTMKTETKPLTFYVEDVEQLGEIFPEFAAGKMKANQLGSRIVELLKAQKNNTLSADSENLSQTLSTLSAENQHLKERETELLADFEQLKADFETLKVEHQSLQEENINLKSLCEENEHFKQDFEQLNQDLNQSKTDFKTLSDEYQQLKDNYNTTLSELKDAQSDLALAKTRIKDLKSQLKANSYEPTTNKILNEVLEVVCERINKETTNSYTVHDVLVHTLLRIFYSAHGRSINILFPITQEEMLVIARKHDPQISTKNLLWEYIAHGYLPMKNN